jgi:PAS domain S-box-containing protein
MSPTRVMVVEDERIVAFNLCQTLKRLGYDTGTIASSGEAALERITEQPPDVVLMDIHLDGEIDGIDAAARIPPSLMVPVIYLTAYSEEATLERARATNPYGYLLKPFSERELHATITMALNKRANDIAMRAREEKLRLALQAAQLASWEVDPQTGHILYKDYIGWSSDASPKVVAESFRDFLPSVHELDQDAVRAAFDLVSGTDSVCEIEFRKTVAPGKERWFRVVGRAVYVENDRRRRIVGVARDITGAKQADRDRVASEQSYRELISTIDGIIWEADLRKEELTYVSDSAERVLGYTAQEWLADELFWEHHLHRHDAERAIAEYQAAAKAGQSYESTYRMIANDGEIVWIHEVVSTIAKNGQGIVLRGVMVDISNVKQAEQEIAATANRLAESEKRLAAILDTAAVGIISVDEDLRIISFNIEAEEIFGYSAEEVLGETLDRLIPAQFILPHRDQVIESSKLDRHNRVKGEWRPVAGLAADGHIVPLTTIVSKVTVAGISTLTAIMRDMTEMQRAEETMRRLLEEREIAVARGETANRAKASFLAVMSHELRTPLNAIIGFSDAISHEVMGPIGNEAYRGYVEDIHHSGDLLLAIVNNILDLSRIEAGNHDFKIEDISLHEAWKPIASTMVANAAAKGVALRVLKPKPGQRFAADRNALSHILLNLVSNAVKFTANGGSIVVSQEDDASGKIAICVNDNGRGIAADRLPYITKPFVQASDSYVRDASGIGLGLAICKSLTEAMAGRLVIESEVGKGTQVRVLMPESVSVATSLPQAPSAPEAAPPRLKRRLALDGKQPGNRRSSGE